MLTVKERTSSSPAFVSPWVCSYGSSSLRPRVTLPLLKNLHQQFILMRIGLSLEKMDELFGVTTPEDSKVADAERAMSSTDKEAETVVETRVERL